MRKTWKKKLVTAVTALAIAGTVFAGQVNGAKAAGGAGISVYGYDWALQDVLDSA